MTKGIYSSWIEGFHISTESYKADLQGKRNKMHRSVQMLQG